MADLGLLGGLAEGLKSGYESYRTERDYLDRKKQDEETKKLAKRQMALELAKSGMMETPEGTFVETSETLAKKDLEKRFKEAQINEMLAKAMKEKHVAATEKEPKATQFAAGGYSKRLEQAEQAFSDLAKEGYDPTSVKAAGQRSSLYPEMLKTSPQKKQEQAERNFVNAILRRESGAAIAPSEFESAEKQYFPRVGDSADVLAQKAENRKAARAALAAEAGPAAAKIESKYAELPSAVARKQSGLIPSAQAAGIPKPGEVQKGYRFKGGDPSKPESWEKM